MVMMGLDILQTESEFAKAHLSLPLPKLLSGLINHGMEYLRVCNAPLHSLEWAKKLENEGLGWDFVNVLEHCSFTHNTQ